MISFNGDEKLKADLIEKWRKEASECDEYDGELLKKVALEGCADELADCIRKSEEGKS